MVERPSLIAASLCCYSLRWAIAGEFAMTGRVNWSRQSNRERMRRQGIEDVKGKTPTGGQPPKRRKLSKAELREQAEAAFRAWREGQTAKDK